MSGEFTTTKKLVRLVDDCHTTELQHRRICYLEWRVVMAKLKIDQNQRKPETVMNKSDCCCREVAKMGRLKINAKH